MPYNSVVKYRRFDKPAAPIVVELCATSNSAAVSFSANTRFMIIIHPPYARSADFLGDIGSSTTKSTVRST